MSGIRWRQIIGAMSLAWVAVVGIVEASLHAVLDASPVDGPRVWMDAPEEVPVGVPFELRVGVHGGEREQVTVSPPASSLVLRIGGPLDVPGSGGIAPVGSVASDSARGWWAIACVAGEQSLPEVRVTGRSEEGAAAGWSEMTPPRTIRVIGSAAAEKGASLRTGLSWLPDEPASTPFSTWCLRGALGLALLFAISMIAARVRRGSARAAERAPQPMSTGSAAREAERALRSALHRYQRGELTAGAAREAAARAVRIFVGRLAGVQGLARCADELDLALRNRGDQQLAAGVSRLVQESERQRYALPAGDADGRSDDVRAVMEAALCEIERAGRARVGEDAPGAAPLGGNG